MPTTPYSSTTVSWAKSQVHIVKMLNKRGIKELRFTSLEDRFALEFRVVEEGISKPIMVRIVVPVSNCEEEKRRNQQLNRLHRVLFNHLKAKFVAIDCGLTEFTEEFMAHLVMTDKDGGSKTMGQVLLPQYKDSIESGENHDMKLLP